MLDCGAIPRKTDHRCDSELRKDRQVVRWAELAESRIVSECAASKIHRSFESYEFARDHLGKQMFNSPKIGNTN
jgi:hypothetical protein